MRSIFLIIWTEIPILHFRVYQCNKAVPIKIVNVRNKNRGWTSQRLPLRQSRDYRLDSTSKIRASIFVFKIEFFRFVVAQKFLNLLYDRVMELKLGLFQVLQSYESWVVMDHKFS